MIGTFVVQDTGPAGAFSTPVDLTSLPTTPSHSVMAGETWLFQVWYRDMNPGPTSNLTDVVAVTFR